jgi:hypothetical protein
MPEPLLWPFPAAQGVTEVLESRTDVLTARAGEQRIALRTRPREIVTLRHRLDATGMARAAELARAGFTGDWYVPLWHMADIPATDLVQGDTEIALDTSVADFRAPDLAAIAVDGGPAALVEVTAVEPDRLLLGEQLILQLPAMTVAAARASVMPVRSAILVAPVDVTRRRQGDGWVEATFLLRDAADPPASAPTTWLGRPVLTGASVARQPMAATLRQSVEYVDNGFGPVVMEPLREVLERAETITLRAQGAAARWNLRRWLLSLRGRQASFWLPTWGRELVLTSGASAGAAQMLVAPVAPVNGYVLPVRLLRQPGLRTLFRFM